MARLEINPRYRQQLAELGLTAHEDYLRLGGVIWCGHPDRHVSHLVLETAGERLPVFLKREHRVRRRDRLAAALAGFGPVSKSLREFALLCRLHGLGLRCPEPVAAGEDRGRAFLLVREEEGVIDLRSFLRRSGTADCRRTAAVRLGQLLARMHNAGIDHPDLYAKHILIAPDATDFVVLDWQRSRWRARVSWSARLRDLAALDATLATELAGMRERLLCLRSYLAACSPWPMQPPALKTAACAVRERSERLLRRRRIREMRQPPLIAGSQNLIWLDGEASCVTRQFYEENQGRLPDYLQTIYNGISPKPARETVALPTDGRPGHLSRRRQRSLARWLWSKLRRRALVSPELRQAGILFRLERYQVRAPRLLAVGQRHAAVGQLESFLLVEPPAGAVRVLDCWLDRQQDKRTVSGWRRKRQVIERMADCLRSIHEADCVLGPGNDLMLLWSSPDSVEVVLGSAEEMRPARRRRPAAIAADLRRLRKQFASCCSRAEQLRFLLCYLKAPRLDSAVRARIQQLVGAQRLVASCSHFFHLSRTRCARPGSSFHLEAPGRFFSTRLCCSGPESRLHVGIRPVLQAWLQRLRSWLAHRAVVAPGQGERQGDRACLRRHPQRLQRGSNP